MAFPCTHPTFIYKGRPHTEAELRAVLKNMDVATAAKYIPDVQSMPKMPFPKSWQELAFKRVLRYAVENGFERVTWDTGTTQADRYDLRQEVNSIKWKTDPHSGMKAISVDYKADNMTVEFTIDEDGRIEGSQIAIMEGKRLDEAVGKEIAQRIIDESSGSIKGEGLKVGGEGMVGFYDKILPAFVNKYVKKWGGKVELSMPSDGSNTKRPSPIAQTSSGEFIFLDPDGEEYRFPTREDAVRYREQIMDVGTEVHELKITPEMKHSVARGQKLFAKRTGETAKLLTDVLPQAHTSVILAGIKSTLVGSELEMTPHAMETIRLLDNEIEYRNYRDARLKKGDDIETIDREFDETHHNAATAGFTNDTRSFAIMAQVGDEMRIDYARAGYTDEDLVGYDELIRNLHTLAETTDFGIVYVFDDILPEERFHVEDLRAGRTDRQALEELKENGLWKNVGVQFAMEYGDLNPADTASEIAAKLATGQAAKYGWDKRPDFAEQSKAFLDTWYDGILRRNAVFIEENGIDAFKEKFRRISNAKTTAGNASRNTKNKGNKRSDGRSGSKGKGARPKQQTAKSGSENAPRPDRRKAQKLSLEQERQYAEALGVDPAKVRVKLRRHAQTLRDNGRDVNDVPYVPGSDQERINEAKNILLDSLLAADESGFTQGDYDYALEQFFNPDLEPRTKTVLGIALIDHLGSTGELEMMNNIADRTIVHVGEAAQALQAASIAAKYDFARGVILAKKALERQGKQLSQENIDEIKKLTEQYAKSQRDKALLAQMLSDAEDVIAEQQAELDEAQQALREAMNDIGATAEERAEMAAALEEALEENEEKDGFIENLKRQLARWKAKAMSEGTTSVRMSAARKQLASEMPMIKAELAKIFPGKALKAAEFNDVSLELPEAGFDELLKPDGRIDALNEHTYGLEQLNIHRTGNTGVIKLDSIIVPKDGRGQGVGSRFMQAFVEWADRNGETIVLQASKGIGATSITRLKDFYKQFGFVENKGRHKDFRFWDNMYRKPGTKLRSVESSEQFDDEHRTMLVKYIANRIFEGDGYQETIDHISDLTNGLLNTDEIRALHNDAEIFTEGSPVEKSPEAIAKQKKRNEHKQAARQFRKEAGIDEESTKAGRKASRVAGARELNSLDKEILKLANGNEMLGAAAIFYNKALNINDWYEMIARGYPDLTPAQQNDLFVKARKLRDQARENRVRFVAEQKGIIKDTKADFEEYKKRMYVADSVIKKHKGTLDAMYRKLQKNLAQQTVAVAEQIAGVPKGLSATGEISMFLRQNGLLLLTHPIRTLPQTEALLRGLLSGAAGSKSGALTKNTFLGNFTDDAGMWSETQLLAYMEKLRNNKYFDDAQAHGVEFTNIGDFNIADEHFVANVFLAMADARKVWLLNNKADSQTLDAATDMLMMPLRIFGRTYKAIEIANTLFGDAARLAAYGYYAEHIADSLDAFESRKAKRYAARAVNAFGGRGDVKSALGAGGVISKLANISLFSARLLVSRPQSLYYLATGFALAPKGMRVQMALDGAKFYGFITLLALLAGLRLNPWDKDFGKMKYDPRDLNIDILAGMDAPLQWLFGVAVGTTQQIGAMARGESSDAIEENFERLFNKYWFNVDMAKKSGNWLEGLRYWRGKASPTVSFGFDYFTGKDFIGRPFNWKNAIISRMIPLSYTQTYNALYYDRFASVMKEPSVATGDLDVINGLITLAATGFGVGISQYPNEDNSHAETLAWEMWEPFPGRELTPEEKTAAIEQKRITAGLRNLYRMRTKAEAEGKPAAAIDAAIKMYSEKYAVDAKTTARLKAQGAAGEFDFVTEKFTVAQVERLLKVATPKERPELESIRAAKLAGAEKKAKKEQEPPKPLAVRLNNADVEGAAKLYNENQSTFTSEQRFEARRKLLQKVLNSHQSNQLTREGYDAAKAILGDEIRFQYIERPRRERVVRGLDSLKGLP